jgi:hypothetical protein
VSEEDWLEGNTLMSAETAGGGEDHLAIFIKENFGTFMQYLKYLSGDDRDLVLSIFCLGSAQNQMADIMQHTQTVCSQRWRLASLKMGFFALMQGHPSEEAMETLLTKAGQDPVVAQYVSLYREHGSFTVVAKLLGGLHRPVIKRSIRAVHHQT